jgi:hypothetical protein
MANLIRLRADFAFAFRVPKRYSLAMHKAFIAVLLLGLAARAWAQTGTVAFISSSFSAFDTDSDAIIRVIFSGSTNGNANIDYRTQDGSAKAGVDYTSTTGTLVFAPGVLTNTFQIPLLTSGGLPSNETVRVELFNPTGPATLASPSNAVLTISTTAAPELNFSQQQFRAIKSQGSATVTVLRTGDSSDQASVDFSTTTNGTAVSGVDYLPTSGTLIFHAGETSKSFSFTIFDTGTVDVKTVGVQLEGADLGDVSVAEVLLVSDKTQFVTVTNDDDVVTITLQHGGMLEVDEGPPLNVFLTGTFEQSVLTIKIKKAKTGTGLIDVGEISGENDAGCRIIDAPGVNLIGSGVQFSGFLGVLRVHDILNGASIIAGGNDTQRTRITAHEINDDTAIDIGSRLSLTAVSFGAGTIDAPSASNISILGDKNHDIAGDFGAQITLTGEGVETNQLTLGRLLVAGTISDVTIEIDDGSVGSISAAQILDSTVTVGFTPDDSGAVLNGGEFTPELSLGSVNVRADFMNSSLVAARIGSVRLGMVTPANGGARFGILADESIGSVTVKNPSFRWQRNGPADQTLGDFHVIH